MATRKTGPNTLTDPKTILEMVRTARQTLGDRGDATGLEQLLTGLAADLHLPEAAIAEELTRDRERVDERRRRIGPELLEAAQAVNCTAEYKHPFASVGCVTFKEVKPGEWRLSILDSVQVDTVSTGSGKILVEQAVARIVEIEESLRRTEAFAKDLLTARHVRQGLRTAARRRDVRPTDRPCSGSTGRRCRARRKRATRPTYRSGERDCICPNRGWRHRTVRRTG